MQQGYDQNLHDIIVVDMFVVALIQGEISQTKNAFVNLPNPTMIES